MAANQSAVMLADDRAFVGADHGGVRPQLIIKAVDVVPWYPFGSCRLDFERIVEILA
jgi:hypothetical protein